jgi:nucleoside-diphosphate-sugar epimerase
VLVTALARELGRRFGRQHAAAPEVDRVIGVDISPPRGDLGAVSFARADIRNPVIAKVIMREQVDTVVHMSVLPSASAGGGTAAKELNVIGTMQLLAAYFKLPVIPTVLGFDPRMQFLNDTDLIDALEHATLSDIAGTFNVAGDGVMMLSQAIRRLGRPSLPMPGFAMSSFGSAMRQARLADFSREQIAFLAFGRGVDTSRMRDVLGFHPTRTTEGAFAEFARSLEPGVISERRVRAAESALLGALGGARDKAAQLAAATPGRASAAAASTRGELDG